MRQRQLPRQSSPEVIPELFNTIGDVRSSALLTHRCIAAAAAEKDDDVVPFNELLQDF